jgi:hypothetical protein
MALFKVQSWSCNPSAAGPRRQSVIFCYGTCLCNALMLNAWGFHDGSRDFFILSGEIAGEFMKNAGSWHSRWDITMAIVTTQLWILSFEVVLNKVCSMHEWIVRWLARGSVQRWASVRIYVPDVNQTHISIKLQHALTPAITFVIRCDYVMLAISKVCVIN